jgi:hypothetical protein
MLFALIQAGIVENICTLADDGDPVFFDGLCDEYIRVDTLDSLPHIGWLYSDGAFTPPDPLPQAKAVKQAALDAWQAEQYATPVVVGGISLAVDLVTQNALTRLFVSDNALVQSGQAQLTDTTGLTDSNGVWQSLTFEQLFSMVAGYSAACKSIVQTYATVSQQIGNAATMDDVNAITW